MAQFKQIKPPSPIKIDQFLGLNESVGDTEIKLGESVKQENFRITKNYKPEKRPGHNKFIESTTDIMGSWHGELGGKDVILFTTGGFLYQYNLNISTSETELANLSVTPWDDSLVWVDGDVWDESLNPAVTQIGAIADEKTEFLWFNSQVHIKTLTNWKTYDGTTYADMVAYVPTVAVNAPPTGGGTLFEEQNLLTGKKKMTFIQASSATAFKLSEASIESVDKVYLNGVLKVLTIDYTVNLTTGTVTFVSAPTNGATIEVEWTKTVAGNSALVLSHKFMVDYGIDNDTNLFIFGGTHEPNTFRYSMVGKPNYFPANAFVNVGSNQFSVTDLVAQQQSLLVFKEDSTYIVRPTVNPLYESNAGLNPYDFGYEDLNEKIGNVAPKGVQLIKDTPVSLDGFSMWLWSITYVETQRGADIISDRMKLSLEDLDLSTAVTFNYQNQKEYWVCVGDKVYIWNYGNDTMYIYTNVSADQFLDVNNKVYFTSGTEIRRFDKSFTGDDELEIPCKLYLGFSDFGSLQYRKMMRDEWVAISPASRTSVDIKFITDKVEEVGAETYTVEYRFLDFDDIDFNDISFNSNVNPQPNRLKAKVKKFTYIQVLFENNTNNETLTILKLLMQAQVQGYSR